MATKNARPKKMNSSRAKHLKKSERRELEQAAGSLGLAASLIELQPRHATVQVSQGRVVLVTNPQGQILDTEPHQGLWAYQTRMLSRYRWTIEGKAPQFSAGSNIDQHRWMGYSIATPPNCKQTPTGECSPLQEAIELRLSRSIGGGMHEEVDVANYTQIETSITLKLEMDCDFGDPSKTERGESGNLSRKWRQAKDQVWELEYDYRAEHTYHHQSDQGTVGVHRGIKLRVEHSDSNPVYQGSSISFQVKLPPHGSWHACLDWIPQIDGHPLPLQYGCQATEKNPSEWDRKRSLFLEDSTQFSVPEDTTLSSLVRNVLDRSKRDLAALRLYDLDNGRHSWLPAAGIPTYTSLFGRDSLVVGWESSLLGADMLRGAATLMPQYQASETDDWRDAQPGRMVHGLHTSPTAQMNYSPHHRYYGDATASNFYPMVVADLWQWTGDKELVRPLIEPALKALAWADKYSLDSDGFYKYRTRSEQGEKNQCWKDSGDSIVHADGSQAQDPLGTCEMQGFVYASKLQFSQMLWWMGEKEQAKKLHAESQKLKKHFNKIFWMEKEGYIALGIDAKKRTIRSIASDPGHCLMLGIVDQALAPRLVHRMMARDMFSGWGLRTLSADHPAYNPFAYHRGTVWPVVNGMLAIGLARYGFHREMNALTKAMFEAASLFQHNRLPEVFAGHPRDTAHPFPGMYTKADWPQAWTASAPFAMIRAMLGIVPFAPMEALFLNPMLPDWLPSLRLERLQVGKALVTLNFQRGSDGKTDFEVVDRKGTLHIVRHPKPWSLLDSPGEQIHNSIGNLLTR